MHIFRLKYSKIRHAEDSLPAAFCNTAYVSKISFSDQAEKCYRYRQQIHLSLSYTLYHNVTQLGNNAGL